MIAKAVGFTLMYLLIAPCKIAAQSFGATNAAQVLDKMKGDVRELAREIERIYAGRCNETALMSCTKAIYDRCRSRFPGLSCPGGDALNDKDCGDGKTCSILWDFTTSMLYLPEGMSSGPNGSPTSPLVIEGICVTRQLDDWLARKTKNDAKFWAGYGLPSPPLYFGGQAGYYRYFPMQMWDDDCGSYDARTRPWYAAATSGPKNIVLVLDTSMSMMANGKLDLLKQASKTVIKRLSVGDRVAIVSFSNTASLLGSNGGYLYKGTENNKRQLVALIDAISTVGTANVSAGFTKAFDVLQTSAKEDYAVNCHTALLLMSGGVSQSENTSATIKSTMQFVQNRSIELESLIGGKVILFTYAIGPESTEDSLLTEMACLTKYGVSNKLTSANGIDTSLESFYLVFDLGLASTLNKDFVAWAEPYAFYGSTVLGTTVSAPVYDRSKDPNIFVGVAAIDFKLSALDIALGQTGTSNASVNRIVAAATSVCPMLDLPPCLLEALRRTISGEQAICGYSNCSQKDLAIQVREEKCPNVRNYPSDLWHNVEFDKKPFLERACCRVGENTSSKTCAAAKSKNGTSKQSGSLRFHSLTGHLGLALWMVLAAVLF